MAKTFRDFIDDGDKKQRMGFRVHLREWREKRGVSRKLIQQHCDMTYATIHRWENDILTSVDANSLWLCCQFLECDMTDLLEFALIEES